MKQIPLTKGKFALVDDEDFEYLSQWKWYARESRGSFYASRRFGLKNLNMHAVLMNRSFVDHIDGDCLNNQKSNLRLCDYAGNNHNASKRKDNTSGYKGVSRSGKSWVAAIKSGSKTIYLGSYKNITDAAKAYDAAAKRLFGNFAKVNFPNE